MTKIKLAILMMVLSFCAHADQMLQINTKKINEMLLKYKDSHLKTPPVAVFDWDNTVIKNDAGDLVFTWMLEHGKLIHPKKWAETSAYLSDESIQKLEAGCTSMQSKKCIDLLFSFYTDAKGVWKNTYNADAIEPAYAWSEQLMAGNTPEQIRQYSSRALKEALRKKEGSHHNVGTRNFEDWIRFYDEMKKLIRDLKHSGFDVWIVSASSQYIVEPFAKKVGIDSNHVIGIRSVIDDKGKLTTRFEGCGTYSKGNQDLITYRQGKRCWINKIIFKMTDAEAMMNTPSPLTFSAGDSDTDVFFVKDAKEMHFVINRNKLELMCNALENKDGKWLINPMFIQPKAKREKPYECSKYGIADQSEK